MSRVLRYRPRRGGFTLIEVLVALVIVAVGMSASLRALMAFDGKLQFAHDGAAAGCHLALQPVYRRSGSAPLPVNPNGSWVLVWEARRPARADETWRLWRLAR